MAPLPTTELDAVNIILGTIGEAPINSLEVISGVVDAVTARNILAETSMSVQAEAWQFNTEKNYTLTPSMDTGEIYVPSNAIEVDVDGNDRLLDVAIRGKRLYDRTNKTYIFSKALSCEIILLLPFEDMPQAARYYITIRAARIFQQRVVGSDVLNSFTAQDEARARAALERYESSTGDYNILTGNYDVMQIIDR